MISSSDPFGLTTDLVPPVSPWSGLGMSQDEKEMMAEMLAVADSQRDMIALLETLNESDRREVAQMAIARGGDAYWIQESLERTAIRSSYKPTKVWGVLATASMAASAYHGYKRNQSIGWAVWWGFMGGLFPVFTPVVAVAQGFGKKKTK
jgi:hypothetical protein